MIRPFCALLLMASIGYLTACSSGTSPQTESPSDVTRVEEALDMSVDQWEPLASPQDLTPLVRIVASPPVPMLPLAFPKEAWDGEFAVRDGHLDTGYRIPSGTSWLEFDLWPRFHQVVALDSIEIIVTEGTVSAFVAVLPTCIQHDAQQQRAVVDGRALLEGAEGGCVRITFQAQEEARIASIRLLSRDSRIDTTRPASHPPASGATLHSGMGAVEGFYGAPWSFRERKDLLHLMSAKGLDTYIYGPKLDPLHRAEWREAYSPETMNEFRELADEAERLGVHFIFGISPFIDFGDESTDSDTLMAKLQSFVAIGVDGFALLADDIEYETDRPVDASMGEVQAETVNGILQTLRTTNPGIEMWFCPTVYSTQRLGKWVEAPAYLQALSALDPAVRILWTGDSTFVEVMDGPDMQQVTELLGRKPAIWDNFWANDGGDGFLGRIVLGPYMGRTKELLTSITGLVNNPCIQGAMARMDLATFASYLDAPETYDPSRAVQSAVATELGLAAGLSANEDTDRELLETVAALFDAHTTGVPGHREMERLIAEFISSLDSDPVNPLPALRQLLPLLVSFTVLNSRLYHSGLDPDFVDEATYPLKKVEAEALVALRALQFAQERLSGRSGSSIDSLIDQAVTQSSGCRFQFSTGTTDGLVAAVRAITPSDKGFQPQPQPVPPPSECGVQTTCTWTPWKDCKTLRVWGLPGAVTAEDGHLEWTPGHPGLYRVAVFCLREDPTPGWSWRQFEIAGTL